MRSSPIRTFSPSDLCLEAGCMVHQQASPTQMLLELVIASWKSVSLILSLILPLLVTIPPVRRRTHTHTPDLGLYLAPYPLDYVHHFCPLWQQKDSVWERVLEVRNYRSLWIFLRHREKFILQRHLQIFNWLRWSTDNLHTFIFATLSKKFY